MGNRTRVTCVTGRDTKPLYYQPFRSRSTTQQSSHFNNVYYFLVINVNIKLVIEPSIFKKRSEVFVNDETKQEYFVSRGKAHLCKARQTYLHRIRSRRQALIPLDSASQFHRPAITFGGITR